MKEIKRFSQFLENFLIIRDETILAKKKNSSSNTNIDETEKFSFSAQGYADGVVYNAEDFDQEILSSLPSPEQQAKIYGPGKTYSDEQIKKALSGDGTTENRSIRSPLRNYYLARERAKNILESFLDQLKATGSRLEKEIPTYDSAKQDFANLYAISEGNNSIKIENFKANCTGYCTPRRGALLNVHAPDFRLYSPHKEETVREIHPIFNSPNSSLQQKMNIHAIRTLFKEVEDFINGKSRIYAFPVATSEKNKILKLSSQAKEYFKSIPIFTSENKESNSSESSYYATITDEMYNKIEKNTSFNKNLISKFHLSDFSSFNKHVYESNNRLKENIKEKDIDNFLDDASKMYKEYIYAAQDFMKQSNVSSFTEEQFFIEFFRYKFNLSSNEVKKIYPLISWARSFF